MGIFSNIANIFKRKPEELPAPAIPTNRAAENANTEYESSLAYVLEPESPSHIASVISSKQTYLIAHLYDMGFVAATIDDSFYLPRPYKTVHFGKQAQFYEQKYKEDNEVSEKYFPKNIAVSKRLSSRVDSRMELYSKIREIYPGFCKDMDKKVPPEDYELYKTNKANLKKCISKKAQYSDQQSLKDLLFNYQDNASKLIDSLDFSKACKIEDSFVFSELETFFAKLSELPKEERTKFSKPKIQVNDQYSPTLLEFAQKLQKERKFRIEKYSAIENLYTKLSKQSHLKLTINRPLQGKDQKTAPSAPDDTER